SLREHPLAGTIGLENADREVTARLARESDVVATRRPDRRRVMAFAEADALGDPAICGHHIDLLAAATVAFKTDAGAVRRVAGRRVDRRRIGKTRSLLRTQIHHEQIRVAALLQAHDHALAIGRKARREGHAGEITDDLALSC